MNVSDGGLKRHAGSLSWEIQVGAGTSAKVGFHGAISTAQRANPDQAVATVLASVIVLADELRAALMKKARTNGGSLPSMESPSANRIE